MTSQVGRHDPYFHIGKTMEKRIAIATLMTRIQEGALVGEVHETVNQLRTTLHLPPIDLLKVERAEVQASGHVEFDWEFAVRCADLLAPSA